MAKREYDLDCDSVPGGVHLMPDEVATVRAALADAQYWRAPIPGSCPDCGGIMCEDHQADASLSSAYRFLAAKLEDM